jgi:hypothetical protein
VAAAGVVARERQPAGWIGQAAENVAGRDRRLRFARARGRTRVTDDFLEAILQESLQPSLRVFDLDRERVFRRGACR